jgi:hypothetical protein
MSILHIKKKIIPAEINFQTLTEENLLKSLQEVDKIQHKITAIHDIFEYIKLTFANQPELHMEEYSFDHEYIYHIIIARGYPNDIIFLKRNIIENDDYDFHIALSSYTFGDIALEDMARVMRERYIHKGVIVCENNEIKNFEYILENGSQTVGSMKYRMGYYPDNNDQETKELLFMNTINLKSEENVNEEINGIVSKNDGVTHLYACYNIGIGILKCFINRGGYNVNNIISNMLNYKTHGDVFLGLENNAKYTRYNINLTQNMLQKMNTMSLEISKEYSGKNKNYCNVYYELYNN